MQNCRHGLSVLCIALVVLLISAWRPHDYFTWLLEVGPVVIGIPVLVFTYKKFPLTPLIYWLLLIHAIILVVGGHYTYEQVPIGRWFGKLVGRSRNDFDRFGHIAQGFVPAILVREILIRRSPLKRGKWLFFLTLCVCGSISALYELIEWLVALLSGSEATAFLATQGDPWDTQWDMFLAFLGAIASQLLLAKLHDRQLEPLFYKSTTT